jgi:hypothetical protein
MNLISEAMKNYITILAMMLMTVTAPGQTSRREANNELSVREGSRTANKGSGQHNRREAYRPSKNTDNQRNSEYHSPVRRQSDEAYYASNREFRGGREVTHHYASTPKPRTYRRIHDPYPYPHHYNFYWTPEVRFEYIRLYPVIAFYKYPVGYLILNVSAYDAMYYRGEVVNVYGKVFEVYYSRSTDEYILYFGAYYPYHDFTAVIPGEIARIYSPWPERYFARENLVVTGLVTLFEGTPEIVVRANGQVKVY